MKPITPTEVREKRKELFADARERIVEYMNTWLVHFDETTFTFFEKDLIDQRGEGSVLSMNEFMSVFCELIEEYRSVGWHVEVCDDHFVFSVKETKPSRELVVK